MDRAVSAIVFVVIVIPLVLGLIFLVYSFVKPHEGNRKKKLLIMAGVVLVIAGGIGLLSGPINPFEVERVELYAYDHTNEGRTVLTDVEANKAIMLYNLSWRGGEVDGEPCCAAYSLEVYYRDGSRASISEGKFSKLIVDLPGMHIEDRFYADSQVLIDYIYILAEKYDLPID